MLVSATGYTKKYLVAASLFRTIGEENFVKIILAFLFLSTPAYCESGNHHAAAPAHTNAPAHNKHWGYGGETGPENWGKLDSKNALCDSGAAQSPVDLVWTQKKASRKIEFHYAAGNPKVLNNGHTIQVNVPPGSFAMVDGKKYSLAQFHFHSVSEHTFSGKHFPLEAHFVHKDESGKLAVVGVMFDFGAKNKFLEDIFSHMPSEENKEVALGRMFNPASLLPESLTHYHYSGSLTTPPCSEGVNWTVLNTPLSLSPEQLKAFNAFYLTNNRPLQPLKNRRPANFE